MNVKDLDNSPLIHAQPINMLRNNVSSPSLECFKSIPGNMCSRDHDFLEHTF